jgi:hypothetical protein
MRILTLLGLAAVMFGAYAATRRQRFGPGASVRATNPQPLQRWEGEGGSVPAANPAIADPVRADPAELETSGAGSEL